MKKSKKIFGVIVIITILIIAIVAGLYFFRYNQKIKKEKSEEERINKSYDSQREYIEEYFGIKDTEYIILSCDNEMERFTNEKGIVVSEDGDPEFNAVIKIKSSMLDNMIEELIERGYESGIVWSTASTEDNEDKLEDTVIYSMYITHDCLNWIKNDKLRHLNISLLKGIVSYEEPTEKYMEITLYFEELEDPRWDNQEG